ncbi:hypothetical protein Tco_0040477 [Tanacetum coccineum]
MLQARENLMETIQAFLKEYDHIPPKEKCMALIASWRRKILKIKQAMEEEQNQPEAEQEEPAAQNFLINLNFPMVMMMPEYTVIYRKPKAITPDLPIEEPDNSLSMGDEHLNTISETEKSSVKNLLSPNFRIEIVRSHIKIGFFFPKVCGELRLIDPILPGINDDDFDKEEGEIDIDIFQIEDEILREKLLNINILIDKIEALNLTSSIPFVLEYPSSSPIAIVDSGGGEIDVSQNIEDDDSFTFVIQTFLPYLTYPEVSPLLLSTGSEDTIFDLGIST